MVSSSQTASATLPNSCLPAAARLRAYGATLSHLCTTYLPATHLYLSLSNRQMAAVGILAFLFVWVGCHVRIALVNTTGQDEIPREGRDSPPVRMPLSLTSAAWWPLSRD